MKQATINYTIPVGDYLKLGYRVMGSGTSFTYIQPNLFYNQSPYTISGLADASLYEFELVHVCGDDCDSGQSAPIYLTEI